jgi:uncharacterized membrane protein
MSASGMSGGVTLAIDSFRPSLVARSTGHQAALFGLSAALGYGAGRAVRKALDIAGVRDPIMTNRWARAGLFAGALTVSAPIIMRRSEQERAAHADWGQPAMRPGVAAAQGTAVAAGLVGTTMLAGRGIGAAAQSASDRFGGPPAVWVSGTALAGAGAIAAVAPAARDALFATLAKAGTTPDRAFAEPPEHQGVSGSPGSLLPYDTHAREGSRFVHLATTAGRITAVTGQPARDPIRVFVGVAAGATPEERVALAVAELQRLGAFQRQAILAVSPAGTGYANPVPVEALELMTGGDCASVAVQYGVLPSMFSASVVPDAALTYRLLVDALQGRGPQVLSYGESLGAQAAQLGLQHEPTRFAADGAFDGIDAALFVGTPAGTGIRRSAEHRASVFVVDRWQDLPQPLPPQYQVFLLDHDADPVTRFETPLLWSRPDWLAAQPRGRGVPDQMAWRPLLTWMQVMFDVARATQPQLGQFQSHGHDYRADLAPLVRAAFVPHVEEELVDAVQEELVRSEVRRSELLAE